MLLGIVTVALAVAAGWYFYGPKSPAQLLKMGEESYSAGLTALQEENGAVAKVRFKEADIHARGALDAIKEIEKDLKAGRKVRAEMVQELPAIMGKAMFLRAIALRDEAFARAMEEGKKIPETLDTSAGGSFRNFLAIPDNETRKEVIGLLRNAAASLPKEKEVQIDALRVEVSLPPPTAWGLIHRFATELIKSKPDDARALYLLARFEFEQPQIGVNEYTGPPRQMDKRQRTRVLDALAHITKLKEVKGYQPGRTLFLEAQVRQWLLTDYQNRGEVAKAQKERAALETLLFDEKSGALARFKSGDGTKDASTWDAEGILGVHLMALDYLAEQQRKKGDALAKVKATLLETIAISQEIDKWGVAGFTSDNANIALVNALVKTQSVLANEGGKEWDEALEMTRKSLKKALEKDIASSLVIAEFAGFLQREAAVAVKAGDHIRADKLRKEARTWVDNTLTKFAERKTPVQAIELHILAAEMKFASEGKRSAIEPHLKVLRDSKNPQAQAYAHLLQGVIHEREGRLEKAKQELEEVLNQKNADLRLRANMALANVYLGLGLPDRALESLQVVEKVYEAYDDLTPQEKIWAQNFLRSPDDMAVLIVAANLEGAKQRITAFLQQQPTKPVPSSHYAGYEKIALDTMAKLPKQKRHALLARQSLINYYAFSGRLDRAEQELATAFAEHPDAVSLLQLEIALMVRKAREKAGAKADKDVEQQLKDSVDKRIEKFIAQFPEDRGARLYWVSWLSRTGRDALALDYLKSPTNFPGVKDVTYQRLLASILLSKGENKEASKILQQMPQDPLIDAMLIQVAESGPAKTKSVEEAMSRYVSNGLFRIWQAEMAFQEKRYIDAANHYFNTLDFTQVKALAQAGLQRSLLALAEKEPAEARKLITGMLNDYPYEVALLLPYAVACLKLDDIGTIEDHWETTKSMASALHAWEQAMHRLNPDRTATTVVKAELWSRSNYPEIARVETLRALEHNPTDPTALTLIIRLDVTLSRLPEARKYFQQLKKIRPDAPSTALLEAQLDNAEGRKPLAISLLETTLEKHPKESTAYSALVSLLNQEKQSAKAMKWSQTWLENLPDDLAAAQNMVVQLALTKKADEAKRKADEFIATSLKKYRKELDERKYADEKEPEKKRAELLAESRLLLELRFAQAFMRGDELSEAERRLTAIVKERDDAAAAYLVLGELYLVRKDWKACEATYTKLLELEKNNFVAGNNLAWVLAVQLNQPEKALEWLRTISKGRFSGRMLPGDRLDVEVLDTLGIVYLKLNRPEHYEEMSQIFEAARKRYPRDPRMYLYQGHAYAGLADNAKAAQMFQSAIALASDKEITIPDSQRDTVIRDAEAARKKLSKN